MLIVARMWLGGEARRPIVLFFMSTGNPKKMMERIQLKSYCVLLQWSRDSNKIVNLGKPNPSEVDAILSEEKVAW